MNDISHSDFSHKAILRLGGAVCIIFIIYSLLTMILMVKLGTPPSTAEECFKMLHENRLSGLLRLDILTVFILPLYYLLFYSICCALKKTANSLVVISTVLIFAGLTLVLATPSVLSMLDLSDKFAQSASEYQRNKFLAAGESILASDMWHGTGARIGGLLLQSGAVLISIVMLKTSVFNKLTAITGIVTHGLDFLHIIAGFFLPSVSVVLMGIAGTLYLAWFPLVGLRLFKLSRKT
jgi:hypothetical protein